MDFDMSIIRGGLIYFGLVFGTGFVLGVIRTLWVVPKMGVRMAELLEMPLMLLAIVIAAQWIDWQLNQLLDRPHPLRDRLMVGLLALGLLLGAEIGVGLFLRGRSLTEIVLDRDPLTGTIYYALLVLFMVMPWALGTLKKPAI